MTTADGKPLAQIKSFTLGTNVVSPLSMAEAYATFAARGTHCNSIAILEVTDPSGNRLPVPEADCQQVLDENIADGMNELLQGVMTNGTGVRAAIGRPAAGKTGTTDSRYQVWFVGYTPDLATAVWAGNPSPPKGGYPLSNISIGGVFYGDVCGGCLPGPIWKQMMSATLANTPVSSFTNAEDDVRNGDSITRAVGHRQVGRRGQGAAAGSQARPGRQREQGLRLLRAGRHGRLLLPGRDASVYPGQRVVIYVSAGAPAPPETTVPSGWRSATAAPVRSPVPVTPAAAPTGPAAASVSRRAGGAPRRRPGRRRPARRSSA